MMAYRKLISWVTAGLAIWLAFAAINTPARAEADRDTSFSYTWPKGWARDVSEDGRVDYRDPENPRVCYIQILPVIPKDLSAASEAWLMQFFNAELRKNIDILAKRGIAAPHTNDPPIFRRVAAGTYTIYKNLLIAFPDTNFDFHLMMLIKGGELQRLSSMIDQSSCPKGSKIAADFFSYTAAHTKD
jgi:hypothetical protein